MEYERIRVERDGDVVTITLATPQRRNVLAETTLHELIAALTEVGRSDATAIVIAAEGPVFSAGHDFADMVEADYDQARALLDTCAEMMQLLQQVPQVVVAKVHALATAATMNGWIHLEWSAPGDSAQDCSIT